MKKLRLKPLISLVLSILLVIDMMPISVFANEIVEEVKITEEEIGLFDIENNSEVADEEQKLDSSSESAKEYLDKNIVEENISEDIINDMIIIDNSVGDNPISGKCGENLIWNFDTSTGTLTINGNGEMEDYITMEGDIPWNTYKNSILNVEIGEGVKNIGNSAFWECKRLSSVSISETVIKIGESSFDGCTNLSSITIGKNLEEICDWAFAHTNIKDIELPNKLTNIGDNAFWGCSNLETMIIPNSVNKMGYFVVYGCDKLSDVYYAGSEENWEKIIGEYNNEFKIATIHYNSTGPDDPGTGSEISYVAGILKSYNPQEQKIYFEYYDGVTSVYEYKITDQTVVEDWDIIIGKPVLVSYIPGEYGTDTLSRYVITVQLAEPIIGNVDTITESTITLDGKVFDINLDSLIGLEYYIGETVACYVINDIIVDMKKLNKETGILNAGSNTSVTIDGVQYAAIFNGIPPYLPAPELWFEHEVEYYFYNDGVNQIIYKISLKSYSSTFTAKLTKWEGNTVTFEDDTIRQVAEDVAFDSTLIGKWVDYTVKTTADGGNVISSIILAKPKYKTEVKKLVAWNDGNPQFSDGTTMGVFIIGDQYDPIMIGRWVKLTIKEDLNTGTRITGISLVEPSSKGDFKLLKSTDIYLKNNQYSFDGQNYEDSSKFEIEFKISIQNIVEGVKDTILSEMKKDYNMNLTVEDIQVIEPNGFNFDWFGLGEIGDVKGLEIQAGEIREVTGFIRPDMRYFVDEKEVTETIKCKIILTNGDVIEKDISFNIHNLDYKEPDQGNSDKELDQIIKDGIKDFEENNISSQIYLDINPMKNVFGISGKALDILECEILTAVIMSNAPENTKVEEFQDELMETVFGKYKTDVTASSYIVPLYYVIKTEKYGELTVRFDCKVTSCSVTDSEVAIHAAISYEIIGQSSKAMLKVPPHLKANSALGQIAVTDGKSFCDAVYKVAEDAISDMYDDIWGDTANRAADILFDGCIKSILEAFDTSVSDITWQIITWPAKNITNACPTDVYIYDKNNVLCGSIINNVITLESNNFELSVEGDIKYIKGLTDDYTIKYVATDNGHMDVEIIEMMSYDKALRTVKFEDVKLVKEVEFTQDISVTMLEDTQSYNLESTTGEVVNADKDDILINFTPDDSETVSVTSIAINKQTTKLSQIGATEQLTATITPTDATNKSVTWTSSNPSVATVDDTGLVTALANGTATITVKTVDGGYTANCMVTVDIKSTSNNGGSNGSSSNSSGGGSVIPISYSISIVDTDGGTITISPKAASKDKRVTITAVPDEGYKLDTLSVYDKNGNQIEFTKKTDIEYTFKMPASKVTVNAIFSKVIVSPEPSSMPFTDVPENAWYYDAIKYIYENNMMQGISNTEFAPNLSMNRAMIVTVLHRLENTPETTIINQFSDVESNQWYTEAVQWAFENDIVNGYSSDKFAPMDNVTREQLAVILYNYTNYKGGNTDIVGDLTAFQDADDISNWSENAISWAIGSGLLSGKGNGILDPKGNATRAEVAQILMNYCIKAAI